MTDDDKPGDPAAPDPDLFKRKVTPEGMRRAQMLLTVALAMLPDEFPLPGPLDDEEGGAE